MGFQGSSLPVSGVNHGSWYRRISSSQPFELLLVGDFVHIDEEKGSPWE